MCHDIGHCARLCNEDRPFGSFCRSCSSSSSSRPTIAPHFRRRTRHPKKAITCCGRGLLQYLDISGTNELVSLLPVRQTTQHLGPLFRAPRRSRHRNMTSLPSQSGSGRGALETQSADPTCCRSHRSCWRRQLHDEGIAYTSKETVACQQRGTTAGVSALHVSEV